jgi:polyhydroxybutyrate depolymerase
VSGAPPLQPEVGTPQAAASTGCGKTHQTGLALESMTSGGIERTYRLYVPRSYDAAKRTPLVLNFHGFGSNGLEQEAYSGMTEKADEAGFITVAPDGSASPRRWHIYGMVEASYVDDFAFVESLIDVLSARLCVDPDRIYATGMSNGGGMSAQSGCRLNHRLAAIAPVAGSPYPELPCRGKAPMPAIIFHGTDDRSVPFEGGVGGRLGLALRGVRQNASDWAAHSSCTSGPAVERIAEDVLRESYSSCRNNAEVVLYVIEAGGHTWPGAFDAPNLGRTTKSIDATDLIWDFFESHPRTDR